MFVRFWFCGVSCCFGGYGLLCFVWVVLVKVSGIWFAVGGAGFGCVDFGFDCAVCF